MADLLGLLREVEQPAQWGGSYSIYTTSDFVDCNRGDARARLASQAAKADSIELELAATAVFLAREGYADPWGETARRKPEKAANQRIECAKALYGQLQTIDTPVQLPRII